MVYFISQITDTDARLNNTQANKARCFLKLLKDKSIILYAHHMLDISAELKKISFVFQERTSSVADIHRAVTGSLAVIKKMNTWFACFAL